jgi:hypothetical protein
MLPIERMNHSINDGNDENLSTEMIQFSSLKTSLYSNWAIDRMNATRMRFWLHQEPEYHTISGQDIDKTWANLTVSETKSGPQWSNSAMDRPFLSRIRQRRYRIIGLFYSFHQGHFGWKFPPTGNRRDFRDWPCRWPLANHRTKTLKSVSAVLISRITIHSSLFLCS